jgi:hypothetical protein
MDGPKDQVVRGLRKGVVIMAAWLIILFGYFIIALAVFNFVIVGSGNHPLSF